MSLIQSTHQTCIKDIYFKFSREQPQYERMSIFLFDPDIDVHQKSTPFLFLPSLHTVITEGPVSLATKMVDSFFRHLLQNGYFATEHIKQILIPHLHRFFLSGLVKQQQQQQQQSEDPLKRPLQLKADFEPTSPLSIYLHGIPGSGKSSLAKDVPIALQDTINEHVDPECLIRYVKQNLNKPMQILELEFDLRPNNNDLSVMSIIQSRKMKLSQSKPGLVVLNLEEMPSSKSDGDPNQQHVAKLISHRFGGRKGDYLQQKLESEITGRKTQLPRNSDRLGLGKDSSLVTIITSNYPLHNESLESLQKLDIFTDLAIVGMISISGPDRMEFAKSYTRQCIDDFLGVNNVVSDTITVQLDIDLGEGDTRPLIRSLRMFAFYLSKLINGISRREDVKFEYDTSSSTNDQQLYNYRRNTFRKVPS